MSEEIQYDYKNLSFEYINTIFDKNKLPNQLQKIIEQNEIPEKETIINLIKDYDKNISLLGLLILRTQYKKFYKRPYITKFFNIEGCIHKQNDDIEYITWIEEYIDYKEGREYEKIKVELSKNEIIDVIHISEIIYSHLIRLSNILLKNNKKNTDEYNKDNLLEEKIEKEKKEDNIEIEEEKKEENKEKEEEKIEENEEKEEEEEIEEEERKKKGKIEYYIYIIFELLLNLYDLDEQIINLFIVKKWINLYENLFKVNSYKINYLILTIIYYLFSIDKTYITYMKLIKYEKKFSFNFFKLIVNSVSGCCCHGYEYKYIYDYIMENFDLLIKVIRETERNNLIDTSLIQSVYYFKIKIINYFIKEIGKNQLIFFFRRFTFNLRNEDIFSCICDIKKFNSIIERITFSHYMEELHKIFYLCDNPTCFIQILSYYITEKNPIKIRATFNVLIECIFISEDISIKELVFNNIFTYLIKILQNPDYFSSISNIVMLFHPFLNENDSDILKIYHKNTFNLGNILPDTVQKMYANNYQFYTVDHLMNLIESFVDIGNVIKKQFYSKNVNPFARDLIKGDYEKKVGNRNNILDKIKEALKN